MPGDNQAKLQLTKLRTVVGPSERTRTASKIRLRDFIYYLRETQKVIRRNVTKLHKEYEDKWSAKRDVGRKPHQFWVGQKVLWLVQGLVGNERKLSPKFTGPYLVRRLRGKSTVELAGTADGDRVVNVSKLKPYYERRG